MISRVTLFAAVVLLASAATAREAAAEMSLEVKNIRVEFLEGKRVRVHGSMRCTDLRPQSIRTREAARWSEIDVNVDFPHGKRGFTLLPERWKGKPTTAESRDVRIFGEIEPFHVYEGRKYFQGQKTIAFYNAASIVRPAVIERTLVEDRDDGRWIAFDKMLLFKHLQTEGLRYRIVFGWTFHHGTFKFQHNYFWAVYGPFLWGEAPPLAKTLRATYRRPASFTEKGLRVKEPIGKDPGGEHPGSGASGEQGEEKQRPKPVRQDKRPSQLDAVNASEKLQGSLTALTEIKTAGARANPWVARVQIRLAATLTSDQLTSLVGRVAGEAAYAYPWVKSLEVVVSKGQKDTMATIPWTAAAAHAAKETTLLEFHKTWKVTGGVFATPK